MTGAAPRAAGIARRGKAARPVASPARASRLAPAAGGTAAGHGRGRQGSFTDASKPDGLGANAAPALQEGPISDAPIVRAGPVGAWLPDGRLHLQHGPIDLICLADGPGAPAAFARAICRFDKMLDELVAELPALRSIDARVTGSVAQMMARAVAPFRPAFITPMAAVAGAVAQTVLAAMAGPGLTRAAVNNGGDIALWLAPGARFEAAMAVCGVEAGRISLAAGSGVAGMATSGWRGRSWSFGIADAVTVLAPTAAMADAAATMVANAVDLPGHPAVTRVPARLLQHDTDLGDLPVTVAVGVLSAEEIANALDRGRAAAEQYRERGLIHSAALCLGGQLRVCGAIPMLERLNA